MESYAPWRIDSELPWESAYSLFSKASWWQAINPSDLLRIYADAILPRGRRPPGNVIFGIAAFWVSKLQCADVLPITLQGTLLDSLIKAEADLEAGVADIWRSQVLRRCPQCIALGVHLWIHQHTAVACCPVHLVPLISACPRCGEDIRLSYRPNQAAFSCECGHSLIGRSGCAAVSVRRDFARYARISSEMDRWLALLNAQALTAPGCGAWQVEHFARLSAYGLQGCPIPECMRRELPLGFGSVLKAIGIHDGALGGVTAEDLGPARSLWLGLREDVLTAMSEAGHINVPTGAYEYCEPLVGMASIAFRRVGLAHLAATSHHDCTDIPKLICGESLPQMQHPAFSELLHCCPVAVGFWIWRMLCGDLLSMISRDPRGGWSSKFLKNPVGGNAALFLLSRSQLHYCIQACDLLSRQYRLGEIDGEAAYHALSSIRSVTGLWGTTGGSCAIPLEANDRWFYTSIDVADLIVGACTGIASDVHRLERFFAIRHGDAIAERYVEELAANACKKRYGGRSGGSMSMMKCDRRIYLPIEVSVKNQHQGREVDHAMQLRKQWLDLVISARGCYSKLP